jgi:gamma-glutamyl:cysteine ligase YbdK (ATP-grasp superfamily)
VEPSAAGGADTAAGRLGLFQGFGIELEYMIVDRETLDVKPVCDELLRSVAGAWVGDVDDGPIAWSNELALHVIELKTNGPAPQLAELPERFAASVRRIDGLLVPLSARLLPTGMHPWMDPFQELRLWPHENDVVYAAFDRIFDCSGHGWANLQSMHVNLPFGDDRSPSGEFGRLHAAIRLVLPLLPALAASSPLLEGRASGVPDTRLEVYKSNSRKVPSVSGRIVPEAVFTRADYEREILGRIYADMREHDPEGILRHEWCNARGAIARFDRSAIEIRVLDVQECPRADLAIAALVTAALQALVGERWSPLELQQAAPLDGLAEQFERGIAQAENAPVLDAQYLGLFGRSGQEWTAGALWSDLARELLPAGSPERAAFGPALDTILAQGPLARRILRALDGDVSRPRLREVYGRLADCLLEGELFVVR